MPFSIDLFFSQMKGDVQLSITVLLILAVLVVNGWTDAPNAIVGVVSTKALSFRAAVVMAACFNFLGVLCVTSVNASVADTVYSIAIFSAGSEAALTALCAAMTSVVLWAVLAWIFGIPTSESHALLAGISGAAVALEGGLACIRWESWGKVIAGLILSAAAGILAGYWIEKRSLTVKYPANTLLLAQLPGAAGIAFLHGAQDGQKFIGTFLLCAALARGETDGMAAPVPVWLMALCAAAMSAGTLIGGRRIIDTVGRDMVDSGPREGLAADIASIAVLTAATLLGAPVSTTHTRTAAILGVGSASGAAPNWRIVHRILLAWILTFPGCMAIGYWTAKLFLALF